MSGPRVLPESAAAAALTRGVSGDGTRHCQSVASFSEGEVAMSFSRRLGRSCVHLALAVALCLGSWGTLQAQTTSASVSGVVMDTSRAVMPGVTITLTSRSQGDVLTTVTDVEGRFVFTIVRPGTYILTASLEGFRTLEQTNLVVNANDRLSAGTLTLDVGSLQESVTVTSRVSELQTTSGERSFAIANEALTNIANNGRQLYNFATLVPGVAMQGDGAGREMTNLTGFTVNGQRPNANNLTIDGVANIDTGDNGGNMASTNIDAVAEFKVLTNAYQAEYGRAVGGQIQVVTKSGTQDFKGSAYWYGRRSDWNATSWINNRDGLVTPKASRDDQRLHHRRADLHPGRVQRRPPTVVLLLEPGVPIAYRPGERAARGGADSARAGGRLLPERRQRRQALPLHPRLHDGAALQRERHPRVLPAPGGARPHPSPTACTGSAWRR
jgi:hypothetical protein